VLQVGKLSAKIALEENEMNTRFNSQFHRNWVLKAIVAAIYVSFSSTVVAQSDDQQSVKLGETDLFPSVKLTYQQDDNAFLSGADDQISTTSVVISPEVNWVADRRLLTLTGTYKGAYSASSESAINYADHLLSANAEAEFTARKRANANLSVELGHEALGINFTRGAAGVYTYGAKNARGNITGGVKVFTQSFNNRKDVTSGRGHTGIEPFGIFSLRVSPDTRVLAEIRYGTTTFGNSVLDRNDLSLLVGATFAATGKLSGVAKIGSTISTFDTAGREDESNLIVESSLRYEATSFSAWTLFANRQLVNDDGNLASFDTVLAVEDEVGLIWNHAWSSRVSHRANIGYRANTAECPSDTINISRAGLELNVQVRRWLTVGANGNFTSRVAEDCDEITGNTDELDFDKMIIGAHIRATL